jgi:uncharacterized membrane protein YphA (DoxX/SURF4 family)
VKSSILIPIVRILFGALFVASAVLKLFPIDAFELVLIKQVGFPWSWAPLMARSIILFEFLLGVCIGFGFLTKRMLWVSLAMLMAFNVFLVIQLLSGAGDENCGCFGELIPMGATTSLGKNFIFMALALFLLWQEKWLNFVSFKWAGPIIGVLAVPALFLVLPMPEANFDKEPTLGSEIIEIENSDQNWDLTEGDKLVVIMYSNCVHCKQLASFLSTLGSDVYSDELRVLIFGPEETVQEFVEITHIQDLPHHRTASRALIQAIDGTVPVAIQLKNGEVVGNWNGGDVNSDLISKLLRD